jgi:hypothetical protein
MKKFPQITYSDHPAFSKSHESFGLNNNFASELVAEIDQAYDRLAGMGVLTESEWNRYFVTEIENRINKLKRQFLETCQLREPFKLFFDNAFRNSVSLMRQHAEFRTRTALEAVLSAQNDSQQQLLNTMFENGYVQFPSDPTLAAAIWRSTNYERKVCVQKNKDNPGRRTALSLHPLSSASKLIRKKLASSGALNVASNYLGCELEWMYCSLELSKCTQNWYRECYIDVGVKTVRTAYMHLDADTEMIKGMLYLNDVDQKNGAFRFVKGSHTWPRSSFLMVLYKSYDMEEANFFEMESDRLDYKLGYYRPRFKLPEWRNAFLALPPILRGTTHFGDDLIDNSNSSNELLAQETVFAGPSGTFLLFDGAKGIHRGGLVEEGERWVVQIGMRAKRRRRNILVPFLKEGLSYVRYQGHLLKRNFRGIAN